MKKRIVITGLGTLNAIANNVPDFARALQQGSCGIGPIELFDTAGFRSQTGGQIKNFIARDYIPQDFSIKRMSRADMLSFAATLEALRDAGLYPLPEELKEEMGVAIGGGSGGLLEAEEFYGDLLKKRAESAKFSKLSHYFAPLPLIALLRIWYCGSKNNIYDSLFRRRHRNRLCAGFDRERPGVPDACRRCGTHVPDYYAAFNALKSVDPDVCRPFDKNRAGTITGRGRGNNGSGATGGGLSRGAKIYGEILGYGMTCDSFHMTSPDEKASGAVRSMQAALKDSGLSIEDIDYINAHGTATPVNDVMEMKAIKEVFGKRAY